MGARLRQQYPAARITREPLDAQWLTIQSVFILEPLASPLPQWKSPLAVGLQARHIER
jgi:hypothetical protein